MQAIERIRAALSSQDTSYEFLQFCKVCSMSEVLAHIDKLEAENNNLRTVMMAAAVEIQEHWDAHCDADGYGPANLMRRLEGGYPEQYGYNAETVVRLEAELERLRNDADRYRWLRIQHWSDSDIAVVVNPKKHTRLGAVLPSLELLDETIDHMRKGTP